MRRIAICALGALVLPLATPSAPGQEKPRVQVQKPGLERVPRRATNFRSYLNQIEPRELQFKTQMENAAELISREEFQRWMVFAVQSNHRLQARVRFLNREGGQDRGERTILVSPDGQSIAMSSSRQPLMRGQLELAVEELEKAQQELGVDPEKNLLALNVVEKAVMKTRRALAAQKDKAEVPEPDTETDGSWMVFVSTAGPLDQTPLQKVQGYLRHTVTSVRYAMDLDEARWTLDEVEESLAVLRALLWEKKSSKKD